MGRLKKLAIFVLALTISVTAMPLYAVSASGEGTTAANPILISTADDLALLKSNNSGKYYRLENDIYLNDTQNYDNWAASAPKAESCGDTVAFDSPGWFEGDGTVGFVTPEEEWTPIESFSGTLDGNGYTIYGLYINSDEKAGFIKNNNGTITELGFEKFFVVSENTAGTVAAVNNGNIIEVYAKGRVISGGNFVGGLVGINNGTISDCASYGSTEGVEYVGGLVGINTATVQTSFVSGTVKGASSEGAVCGDSASLVGNASVTDCFHCVEDAKDDNAQYKSTYTSAFIGFDSGVWEFDSTGNEFPKLKWAVNKSDNRCGEDLFWTLDDGVFTFEGTGALFDYNETPWNDEASSVTTFNIGKDITDIDESILKTLSAFENLETISVDSENTLYQSSNDGKFLMKENEIVIGLSEDLPDIATSIGEYAFYGRNIGSVIVNKNVDNEYKANSRPDGSGVILIKSHAFEKSTLSEITIVGNPEIQAGAIPNTAKITGFKNASAEAYSIANGNEFTLLDNFSCNDYQNPSDSVANKNYFRVIEEMSYAGYYKNATVDIAVKYFENGVVNERYIKVRIENAYKYINSDSGSKYAGDDKYFAAVKMTNLPTDLKYIEFTFTPSVTNIYGGSVTMESKVLVFNKDKMAHEPTEEDYDTGEGIRLSDKSGDGINIGFSGFDTAPVAIFE